MQSLFWCNLFKICHRGDANHMSQKTIELTTEWVQIKRKWFISDRKIGVVIWYDRFVNIHFDLIWLENQYVRFGFWAKKNNHLNQPEIMCTIQFRCCFDYSLKFHVIHFSQNVFWKHNIKWDHRRRRWLNGKPKPSQANETINRWNCSWISLYFSLSFHVVREKER